MWGGGGEGRQLNKKSARKNLQRKKSCIETYKRLYQPPLPTKKKKKKKEKTENMHHGQWRQKNIHAKKTFLLIRRLVVYYLTYLTSLVKLL